MSFLGESHITKAEYACPHCGALPPGFRDADGEIDIPYLALFRAYEQIRAGRGGIALHIVRGGGYRCLAHNRDEYERWVLGGKKGNVHAYLSTHTFGLALDLQADGAMDQSRIVSEAKKVKPLLRIGWRQYMGAGSHIVHIDYGQFIEPPYSLDLTPGIEW